MAMPAYADYALADRMAKDTAAVLELLGKAWEPAKAKAAEDRALLTATAKRLEEPTPIAAWDWRYLAEKVRQQQFDLDDAQLKPYFTLDNMIAAMFDCAGRLFGLRFVEQSDPGLYHPDVRLWEVRESRRRTDRHLPGRQLRPAFQAQWRMDERLSQPVGH